MPVAHPLVDTCQESFWLTPGVVRMRDEGPQGRWAADLVRLAASEEVAPLRRVLTELAGDGLRTLEPILRFEGEEAAGIPHREYARASAFAAGQLRQSPGAAYVITMAAVFGWSASLGEKLGGQEDGFPPRGWVDMPYAYAQAVLKLGDAQRALHIVDLSYDVLMASRFHDHPALLAAIAGYRTLAGITGRRLAQAVENLADDLLRSGFRAHLMALMWTLGFVPECESLRRSGQDPSRPLLRTMIRLSLDRIPHDPLTQYVWLELKDKPPLDLRGHQFFALINRRYNQYWPDAVWPTMPSQLYARTLIAWLDGSLTAEDVGEYLGLIGEVREFEEIRENSPGVADWSVYLRMISLAYLLAGEYDMFADHMTPERELETWRSLFAQVTRMRSRHHLNPHRSDLGTLNYPMFHLVERLPDPAEVVRELEGYRAAAMNFSLAVTPPGTTVPERETELLRMLRAAYFLVNVQFLPRHFRRYAKDLDGDPPDLRLETGWRDYVEVERQLDEFYVELGNDYAAARRDPVATVESIARALGQHRR